MSRAMASTREADEEVVEVEVAVAYGEVGAVVSVG